MGRRVLHTTLRRWRSQWRLVLSVIAVATLAATLVTSLGMLLAATEQGGVRGALAEIPASRSALQVHVVGPRASAEELTATLTDATAEVYGDAATLTSSTIALSRMADVDPDDVPAPTGDADATIAYLAQYDGFRDHVTLTEGVWPEDSSFVADPDSPATAVAIPRAAADALDLTLGERLDLTVNRDSATVVIVGTWEATDPSDAFWNPDPLHGGGYNPEFPTPGITFFVPIVALGPLVAAPAVDGAPSGLAASGIPLATIDVDFRPDFTDVTVDALGPVVDRLDDADVDIPTSAGRIAESVFIFTDSRDAIAAVLLGLSVTRSTVVVVSLLLLVLAIAAMSQTARLYTDARDGERQLMRSRGAGTRDILSLALVEALVIGLATAALSPLLATLVYRGLAAQPPMVAAGMPADVGLPVTAWLTAGALALVFAAVLVAPLLRRSAWGSGLGESEQATGRARAGTVIARSGIDLGIVVLAAIAYWQLRSYQGSTDPGQALLIDPVLAAGPALVLIAGALVCVRLIPASSRLLERLVGRARGALVALAAWEIARRSRRATAVVLLLSLSLAVGTFGLSFLSTWKQSQVDQAAFAVGAPVRVTAEVDAASAQSATLGDDTNPQPVSRGTTRLTSQIPGDTTANETAGVSVQMLGLTADARDMLDRGRLAEEGGSAIADRLSSTVADYPHIAIPDTTVGIAATVAIADVVKRGVTADIHVFVEDAHGLLSVADLGTVPLDGRAHAVSGTIGVPRVDDRAQPSDAALAAPLTITGFQAIMRATDGADDQVQADGRLLVGDLATVDASGGEPAPITGEVPAASEWTGVNPESKGIPVVLIDPPSPTDDGVPGSTAWQLAATVTIPAAVQARPAVLSILGWSRVTEVPAMVPTAVMSDYNVDVGSRLGMTARGYLVQIVVVSGIDRVPGAATAADIAGGGSGIGGNGSATTTMVVDQQRLAHALAQAGAPGPFVDEWWLESVPTTAQPTTAQATTVTSAADLAVDLQQAPLRVGTQAALWLAILAGAVLAAIGFAVHTTSTLRSRGVELAQLRAIGFTRGRLVGLIAAESLLLAAIGTIFGVAIGVLLAWLVGPLVAVSPAGTPTIPSVIVEIPWPFVGLLALGMAALLAAIVTVVALAQRYVHPADLLRGGSES